jgi:hypothetical protein
MHLFWLHLYSGIPDDDHTYDSRKMSLFWQVAQKVKQKSIDDDSVIKIKQMMKTKFMKTVKPTIKR